jgi:hypothetical protein
MKLYKRNYFGLIKFREKKSLANRQCLYVGKRLYFPKLPKLVTTGQQHNTSLKMCHNPYLTDNTSLSYYISIINSDLNSCFICFARFYFLES